MAENESVIVVFLVEGSTMLGWGNPLYASFFADLEIFSFLAPHIWQRDLQARFSLHDNPIFFLATL